MMFGRVIIITALTMPAFAGNSILARLALTDAGMDPTSFMFFRLASGAAVLGLVVRMRGRRRGAAEGSWRAGMALFAYAATFSFAYVSLSAGTGALLLFAAVQATMIATGIREGEPPGLVQAAGLLMAFGGIVALLLPGVGAPSPVAAILMVAAGISWGVYSLCGRRAGDAAAASAGNFLRATELALPVAVLALPWLHVEARGVALALASGGVASGLGYLAWYAALPGLSATRAAATQLSVPVLTALGGAGLLGEPVSLRFVLVSAATLGGIALVILGRAPLQNPAPVVQSCHPE